MANTYVIERESRGIDRWTGIEADSEEEALEQTHTFYPDHHEDLEWTEPRVVQVYEDDDEEGED